MNLFRSILFKIGMISIAVAITGLYFKAAAFFSNCLGVPTAWITAGVVAAALLWEAGEYLLPWVQLRWLRYKSK